MGRQGEKQEIDAAAEEYETRRGETKLPITIKGRNLVAALEGNEALHVQALQIWVATPAARLTHDVVTKLLTKGNNKMNIIPGTLRRENPELYYKTIKKHAKWLEDHRNIQIFSVTKDKYKEMSDKLMTKGKINAVHRTTFGDRLNISTMAANYEETKAWVYEVLKQGGYIGTTKWNTAPTATTDHSTVMTTTFSKYGIGEYEEMEESGSKRSRR